MQLAPRRRETWDPFREFEDLSNRFHRLLSMRPFGGNGEQEELTGVAWAPACDISETEKEYRVQAELPNVKKDDVHVTLEDGILTIRGERKEEKEEKGEKFHRRELSYGQFLRRFTLPADADDSSVKATFKDGMLKVDIARSKVKTAKAKEIAVQ